MEGHVDQEGAGGGAQALANGEPHADRQRELCPVWTSIERLVQRARTSGADPPRRFPLVNDVNDEALRKPRANGDDRAASDTSQESPEPIPTPGKGLRTCRTR